MTFLSDWLVISKIFDINRHVLFFLLFFFFFDKRKLSWMTLHWIIHFFDDLFWPFLKRLPWNKSWKCRGMKSYQMQFMNINAFTINPIKITRARWFYQTYGKRSLKKWMLMFFSAAKVNWLHSVLYHLTTLKLQSFLVKNIFKNFLF